MESCGYRCLRYLYAKKGRESLLDEKQLECFRNQPALSFAQLLKIVIQTGFQGRAYQVDKKSRLDKGLPCIAHVSFAGYEHYVVLLRYGTLVWYQEPGRKLPSVMPKMLFDLVFTGHIFVMDCF